MATHARIENNKYKFSLKKTHWLVILLLSLQEEDHVKTVLVCRVKRKVKPRDCLENITELGRVLKILTKKK